MLRRRAAAALFMLVLCSLAGACHQQKESIRVRQSEEVHQSDRQMVAPGEEVVE